MTIEGPDLHRPLALALTAEGEVVVCARWRLPTGVELWLHRYDRLDSPAWDAPMIERGDGELGCAYVSVAPNDDIAVLAYAGE